MQTVTAVVSGSVDNMILCRILTSGSERRESMRNEESICAVFVGLPFRRDLLPCKLAWKLRQSRRLTVWKFSSVARIGSQVS